MQDLFQNYRVADIPSSPAPVLLCAIVQSAYDTSLRQRLAAELPVIRYCRRFGGMAAGIKDQLGTKETEWSG
jgi:hypothetical protein